MASIEIKHRVYKVCGRADWIVSVREGVYLGSADDRRDGFIHFSTAEQLPVTVKKFFKGLSDQVLVMFDARALGPALKWELSRGGALFPHHYGPLCDLTRPFGGAIGLKC